MGWFENPRFLGVDFGTSSLKIVEVMLEGKKPVLVNYAFADFSHLDEELKSSARSYDESVGLYFRGMLEKMKPKTNKVAVGLPAYTGLITIIDLPEMDDKDLGEAVKYEAHKYVPSALEDVSLSWERIGKKDGNGEGGRDMVEILLIAALNKEILRYRNYVEAEHLNLTLLEIETFALVRALIGKTPGIHLILDIGSRASNLILVENGIIRTSRNIDIGGKDLTRTLSEVMEITKDRAEDLKKGEKDFLNQPESAVTFPTLEFLTKEAKRTIEMYLAKHPDAKIESIVLSGGSSQLLGVGEYFTRLLGIPVRMGSPWENISFAKPEMKDDAEKLGAGFAVALGLALGCIENLGKKPEPTGKYAGLKKLLQKEL